MTSPKELAESNSKSLLQLRKNWVCSDPKAARADRGALWQLFMHLKTCRRVGDFCVRRRKSFN